MAYIRKYRNGWRAEVQRHGHRATHTADTKREAQAWGLRKEQELDALKGSGGVTFQAAVTHYLKTVSTTKKEGAVVWEERKFAIMAKFIGADTPLASIDSALIGRWRDHRKETVADSTVLREFNLLRHLLTVACHEWKWIKELPYKGVRMPDEPDDRELVWGWRDIRRMLRHCEASEGEKTRQMGRAFHIALRTGMRLKEILQAELVGQIIVITDSKTTKKGKVVKIPTTSQGRRIMARYAGQPFTVGPNEGSTLFNKAAVKAGIRKPKEDGLTFHDSRATALTHMSKRMPVQRLQRISRHRDINVLIRKYYRETAEQISAEL